MFLHTVRDHMQFMGQFKFHFQVYNKIDVLKVYLLCYSESYFEVEKIFD
jgi:hypothetical protein